MTALLFLLPWGGSAPHAAEPVQLKPRGHQGVKALVDRLVTAAEAGQLRSVRIAVTSTYGWGCDCPPFVFSASGDSAEYDQELIFPKFKPGLRDATRYESRGSLLFTGHFTGRLIDMFTWISDRREGRQPDADEVPYWKVRHPEFMVTSWCYRPSAASPKLKRDQIPPCDPPRP